MTSDNLLTVGKFAAAVFRKHFDVFYQNQQNILTDSDIEHLHKTRVALRRLRTALRVFQNAVELPKPVSDKRIGTIVRRLGAVRDLDVFKIHVAACRAVCGSVLQQVRLDDIIRFLSSARAKEFKKLQKEIEGHSYQEFIRAVETWLFQPRLQALLAHRLLGKNTPHFMLPGISELFLHPGLYAGVDTHGTLRKAPPGPVFFKKHDAALHSLRRCIRRTRYAMEFFQEFYSEEFKAHIKRLEEAQEHLGILHDHVAIENLLTRDFDPKWKTQSTFAALFFDEQKSESWKQWKVIQKSLLNAGSQGQWFYDIIGPQNVSPQYKQKHLTL